MLKGQVALVTGGSRGIGKAISLKLAENGADVAVVYAGNEEAAAQTCAEIEALGSKAKAYRCNVADGEAVAATVKQILQDFEKIDILVNNAGITRDSLAVTMKEEDFAAVIGTNLTGAFHMIKQCGRHFMHRKSGKIINISSVAGLTGNVGQANYSAAKAGLIGLTKTAAKELAGRGITCNAIAPGFIDTEMTRKMPEKARNAILAGIPARRAGKPEDIAALAEFLAEDCSSYITGEVIRVDGGLCM